MLLILCMLPLLCVINAAHLECRTVLAKNGLSSNFNETIGHSVHSMTVQGLRIFSQTASEDNHIPTVSRNLVPGAKNVLPYAPDVPLAEDFNSDTMNTIDGILSTIGQASDGLGENWSPIERVVHTFHMQDLWGRIHAVYQTTPVPPPSVCQCLLDTESNGIQQAVEWVAQHYQTGTPITLLNRPIPRLTDATTWQAWKNRVLHYYTLPALTDAAMYLRCVTAGM